MTLKKTYKKDKHTGYEIGKNILIHSHINNPESWFVTIRPIEIYTKGLCKKTCTEAEIARYINVLLHSEHNIIEKLIKEIMPFT